MIELGLDLLGMRDAALPELVDAMVVVVDAGGPASTLDGLSELVVDEAVRLVRSAQVQELTAAGRALSRFLGGPVGRSAQELSAAAHDRLVGLVPVLGAASSPASKGGDALVLRSWNGKAEAALDKLAAAGGTMKRAALRLALGVSESYVSHLLADLEGARLVERVVTAGRRGVTIHLTAEGRGLAPPVTVLSLAPGVPLAAVGPAPLLVVPPPSDEQLNRRLLEYQGNGEAKRQFELVGTR